jgi:glycosyltransferase involved in cell wall biosynthesis
VITSKSGMRHSQALNLLECRHIAIPVFGESGHPWLRRLKSLGNRLCLALVALRAILEIRRQRVEAVITVIQGRYYLAAGLACWITSTPHIAIVHDNFVSSNAAAWDFLVRVQRRCTANILRHAAHIYVVSPQMQRLVFSESGRESEIQWPSTTRQARQGDGPAQVTRSGGPVILFAGTLGYTVDDAVDLLAGLIVTGQLKQYGISDAKLHLCTKIGEEEKRARGWDHPDIVVRDWVPQSGLHEELRHADILFLPYSFSENARAAVETAFASKTADYLAVGKPVLVFGPKNSTLVRYASEQGFAEIVDEFSATALARGIQNIKSLPAYKDRLAARALEVFSANHDIACQQDKFYLNLERIIRASCKT